MRNKKEILNFFVNNNVKYFVIGTGTILAFELAEFLEEHDLVSSISVQAAKLVKNKYRTKLEFKKLGIITPEYMFIKSGEIINVNKVTENLGLPCVIKSNTDAIQPVCVYSLDELKDAIEAVKKTSTDILIEKCILGGDVTVCVASDGVNIHSFGPLSYSKAKEYELKGFKNPYALTASDDIKCALSEQSIQIVKALGLVGVVRVDYIVNNDTYYALEVNAVIVTGYHGSAYPFFRNAGVNVAKVCIENAVSVFSMYGLK